MVLHLFRAILESLTKQARKGSGSGREAGHTEKEEQIKFEREKVFDFLKYEV